MDLMEIAQTRNQIHELTIMVLSLKRELRSNQATLNKVETALLKKKFKNNSELKNAQKEYQNNIKEIEDTIKSTSELIDQLRYRLKPRAQMQITQKLI